MKCTDLNELISLYIDNMLDEHTNEIIDRHIQECDACRGVYQELKSILDQCKQLSMMELPEDFEASLHKKLVVASAETFNEKEEIINLSDVKNKKKIINWKYFTSIAAVLIVFIVTVSVIDLPMKRNQYSEMPMENGVEQQQMLKAGHAPMAAPFAAEEGIERDEEFGAGQYGTEASRSNQMDMASSEQENLIKSVKQKERKIIKNAYIHVEVTHYDEKFNQIMNTAVSYGGYVENSDTQYKYNNPNNPEESLKFGNMLIRVPENQMENIIEQIKSLGNVTNFGINGSDITLQYRDTANEVENLKIQETRLREIMDKANTVKDVLEVERELSRVRGEINRLTGEIQHWDNLVSLSTIQVSLNEISSKDQKIQSPSEHVWEKAKKGFIKTINQIVEAGERLVVGFISILPIILLAGLVVIPSVWFVIKTLKNKKN